MLRIRKIIFAGFTAAGKMRVPAIAICLLASPFLGLNAYATPFLGSAQNFAVLGGSAVTNNGATTVNGDLGVSPGATITDNGTLTVNGTQHSPDDAASIAARSAATTASGILTGLSVTSDLSLTPDLGTVGTLGPGVYFIGGAAGLTGTLTLNAGSDPNALFVFQIVGALSTAAGSVVDVINGGLNNGVFWQIGGAADLGTGSTFEGNILSTAAVTLESGATNCGRVFAGAALTLNANTVSDNCADSVDFGSDAFSSPLGLNGSDGGGGGAVPEPSTILLLGSGLTGLVVWGKRKK